MAKKAKKPAKKVKKPVRKTKKIAKVKASPAADMRLIGFIGWYGVEIEASKRMIKAIPDDKLGAKMHEKFRTPGELGTHLGDSMRFLSDTLKSGKIVMGDPSTIGSTSAILSHYEKESSELINVLKKIKGSALKKNYPFEMNGQVIWNPSGYELIHGWICHEIHHRAQIGTLLRLSNAKVPGMYGPTADDMM